jgi:hypothetical protein
LSVLCGSKQGVSMKGLDLLVVVSLSCLCYVVSNRVFR